MPPGCYAPERWGPAQHVVDKSCVRRSRGAFPIDQLRCGHRFCTVHRATSLPTTVTVPAPALSSAASADYYTSMATAATTEPDGRHRGSPGDVGAKQNYGKRSIGTMICAVSLIILQTRRGSLLGPPVAVGLDMSPRSLVYAFSPGPPPWRSAVAL